MGESDLSTKRGSSSRSSKRRSYSSSSASSSSPSSSSGSDSENPERRRSRRRQEKRHKSGGGRHRSRKEREREVKSSSRKRRKSSRRDEDDEEEKRRRRKRKRKERKRRSRREETSESESPSPSSNSDGDTEDLGAEKPEAVVRGILKRFPDVAGDLKQLLQMIDSGQAVDIRGIPNKTLVKLLKDLFRSLNLKQNGGLFLLPPKGTPTLDVVGQLLLSPAKPVDISERVPSNKTQESDADFVNGKDESHIEPSLEPSGKPESSAPQRRRLIGPEMPSSELLAAAAELTEAEAALRDVDFEASDDLFIGPPPPALAAEAESANEAERFEEVERIVGAEVGKPYDVLGVNHRMSFENIKKRYWKLSLLVHPDKCSHPQAQQAFVLLNQALKELQDPDKRKEIDDKIKLKEEEEAFKVELKALREAAQWRQLQGISLEGDDELLAEPKQPPKRDEWMTTLPPERKPGMTMQSTFFSRTGKEERGDTSAWTDNPLEKTLKAKQNYLEAYNKATALAAADTEKTKGSDADLVDMYNRSKRSISLVQKHQEEISRPKKKKSKQKEEWVDQHPWKPWDREKDLVAGGQKVNFDADNMTQGLTSRFSSGTVQRNFL